MSNIFGGNTPWSYEDIQRKRKIADQLIQQNVATPKNAGEGIAAIGRALAARGIEKRASRRDSELKEQFSTQFDSVFGGGGNNVPYAAPDGEVPKSNDPFKMSALRDAFASVESAGSGDYKAVGPQTSKGRAYGRYQVMDFNIPTWTQQVLGRAYTPQEFLADEAAQDAVFDAKMQEYMGQHGSVEDAASMWFSGRPMSQAGNASDGYNTVPQYVGKITKALGGGGGGGRSFDPAMLAQLASNPYADPGQKRILEALLGQQMQTLDPSYQMGLEKARLDIEQARLDLDQDRNPDSNATEWGLTPQLMVNENGEIGLLQLAKDGTSKMVDLPKGWAASKGITKIDLDDSFQWVGPTGEPIGNPIKKNIAEATGQEEGAKAAMEAGVSAWESYGKMHASLANIEEAIKAIDSGAKSGIVYNMLPDVTLASASLNNAMQRMGLDVIGAVTFGALSEGEMKLAMSTAVPQNLEPQELRAWLVKRRDAQQKAAAMLADAAQFLTEPGNTINGWIAKNKENASTPPDTGETGGDGPWPIDNDPPPEGWTADEWMWLRPEERDAAR